MKQQRISVRIDEETASIIKKIGDATGARMSTVIRTSLLQLLNIKQINVNDIQEFVNDNKKEKEILLRIDSRLKERILKQSKAKGVSVSSFIRESLYGIILSSENEEISSCKKIKTKKHTTSKSYQDVIIKLSQSYKIIKDSIIQDQVYDEDIFQDTIVLLSSDDESLKVKSRGDLISLFKRKYNMLMYRNRMSEKQRKGIEYADYKQAKEETEE